MWLALLLLYQSRNGAREVTYGTPKWSSTYVPGNTGQLGQGSLRGGPDTCRPALPAWSSRGLLQSSRWSWSAGSSWTWSCVSWPRCAGSWAVCSSPAAVRPWAARSYAGYSTASAPAPVSAHAHHTRTPHTHTHAHTHTHTHTTRITHTRTTHTHTRTTHTTHTHTHHTHTHKPHHTHHTHTHTHGSVQHLYNQLKLISISCQGMYYLVINIFNILFNFIILCFFYIFLLLLFYKQFFFPGGILVLQLNYFCIYYISALFQLTKCF